MTDRSMAAIIGNQWLQWLTNDVFSAKLSRIMRKLIALLSLLILCGALLPERAMALGDDGTPKTINFYLGYQITDSAARELAQWDIVVLDMDQQFQFPHQIQRIRQLNPDVEILAYVSAGEIAEPRFRGHPDSPGRKLASRIPQSWFLTHPDGSRASWWPGAWAMNATNLGPRHNGQRWNTFLGGFIRDEMMSTGLWDGVFLDAAYEQVTGFYGPNLDPDSNGIANPSRQTDQAYQEGMETLISEVRKALGPDKLILNNSSPIYTHISNGALFENFPRYGFITPFNQLRDAIDRSPAPKISAINTNTDNREEPWNYRQMRLGLTSALIADAYYSFDAGDANHHRTWWYDEYDAVLGTPRFAPREVTNPPSGQETGVWWREYTKGIAIVNPTNQSARIELPDEFERLSGEQDPQTNNGELTRRVTVPAEDGLVLLRRGDSLNVEGQQFINGQFYRVLNERGEQVRNGFFATRDDVPGGANVLLLDLDRDGTRDIIYSANGTLTMRFGNGAIRAFKPYGQNYNGGIHLSAGQTDRTESWELVLTPTGPDVASTVLIVRPDIWINTKWLAYLPQFRGGSTVGIGDFDGDGLREIVTAPGFGGGPHVRSFKTDGAPWYGGFFAFPANQTGGTHISTGDVDGDGRDEIVVGSGRGETPRIRVYDGRHVLESEFTIDGGSAQTGVRPSVLDIDGDGKSEILVPSSPL